MRKLISSMVFLAALPLTAAANPYQITTRTTGIMQPNADVLGYLGLDVPADNASQPYVLTLTGRLTLGSRDFHVVPWRSGLEQDKTPVQVTFDFGGQHLEFNGIGDVFVAGGDTYMQEITFPSAWVSGGRTFSIVNIIALDGVGFENRLSPTPLTDIDSSGTASGASFQTYIDPLAPYDRVSMDGQAFTVSVSSISSVPEPAHAAMLAGGALVLLGLGRWRRAR